MNAVVTEVTGTNVVQVATPGPQGVQGVAGSGSYTTPLAVAQLPASPQGTRAIVTDSTTAAFYAVASGGGGFTVPVYFDGAVWRVG